jgi:hypothetical protein
VDPVETFKFSCPGCGQHLEARAEEAGQVIVCPLCAKQLVVPQAPAGAGSKLMITAAMAPTRRTPPPTSAMAGETRLPAAGASRRPYAILALVILVGGGLAAAVFWHNSRDAGASNGKGSGSATPGSAGSDPGLWTTNFNQLDLPQHELVGRLNGWDFAGNRPVWRGTKLILRQRNAKPSELGIELELPLKGGELVSGKRFQVCGQGDTLPKPVVISWRDEQRQWQRRPHPQGYILKLEFTKVTPTHVSGRIHLCLDDPARSWVAGGFDAEVKTKP